VNVVKGELRHASFAFRLGSALCWRFLGFFSFGSMRWFIIRGPTIRYGVKRPANGVEINYTEPAGKCSAFYIPSREVLPKRRWIAFYGNGSLALAGNILVNYPVNGDAFLLVDYPSYGKNAGYATIDSKRASTDAALRALEERLHMPEKLTVVQSGIR
jgi:hypothetical protein